MVKLVSLVVACTLVLSTACSRDARKTPAVDAAAAPSSLPPDTAEDPQALCARLCTKLAERACPVSMGCEDVCVAGVVGGCATAWRPYYSCVADLPLDLLTCNAAGRPDVVGGNCGSEHEAVRKCLFAPRD